MSVPRLMRRPIEPAIELQEVWLEADDRAVFVVRPGRWIQPRGIHVSRSVGERIIVTSLRVEGVEQLATGPIPGDLLSIPDLVLSLPAVEADQTLEIHVLCVQPVRFKARVLGYEMREIAL